MALRSLISSRCGRIGVSAVILAVSSTAGSLVKGEEDVQLELDYGPMILDDMAVVTNSECAKSP